MQKTETADWSAVRLAVLDRDAWSCLSCSALTQDVHRRIQGGTAARDPLAGALPNLVAPCDPCGELVKARDFGTHDRGLWLWRAEDPAERPVYVPGPFGFRLLWLLANGDVTDIDPAEAAE